MAARTPAVLIGTSPNFTGIGELQTADTLSGVFNHADITSNSLAARVGTGIASLSVADNTLVGRVGGSTLGSMNAGQLSVLMETVMDRAGAGFSNTGQFIAYQSGTGFVAVTPGADGEALVFNSGSIGGIAAAPVASALTGLSDVTITSPAIKQTLRYDGAGFVNAELSSDDISDIDTTTSAPSTNDVLTWDGTNFVPQAPATSPFVPGDDFGGADVPNTGNITLVGSATLALSGGGTLSEVGGDLTLTTGGTNVAVASPLSLASVASQATPTNVLTSNSGVVNTSTVAQLAAQIDFEDLSDTPSLGSSGQVLRVAVGGGALEFATVTLATNLSGAAYQAGRMLQSNGTAYADVAALLIAEPTVNGTGTLWAYDDVAGEAAEIAPGTTGQYLTANTGAQPSWTSITLTALSDVTVTSAAEGDFLLRDATDFKNVPFVDEVDKYTYANADALRRLTTLGTLGADSVNFDYKAYVSGGGASGDFYAVTVNEGNPGYTLGSLTGASQEYPEPGFNSWAMEIRVNASATAGGIPIAAGNYWVRVTKQTRAAGTGAAASGIETVPSSYVRFYRQSDSSWSNWHPVGSRQPWYVEGEHPRDITLSGLAHSHDGTYEMVLDRGYLGHSRLYVAASKYPIYYDSANAHCVMWDEIGSEWTAFDTTSGHPSTWIPGQLIDYGTHSVVTVNSENWGQISGQEMLRPASSDPNVTY